MNYRYPISKCDVRQSEYRHLERFRECLDQWRVWLSEDEHSIWQQIHGMLWNDMVWRTVNEARRLADKKPSQTVGFNTAVASFMDQGYVANQLLAIRRLTEQTRRRDGITLPHLLNDMKANAHLFNREIYVCHDGLPFDPEPARQRSLQKLAEETSRNGSVHVRWMPTHGPQAHETSVLLHRNFDELTGAVDKPRSRDDTLSPSIFDDIKSKLGFCSSINTIASKFIAHAADASSRAQINKQKSAITLKRIEECQQIICRVAAYITGPLLYLSDHGLVPTPQYNQLEDFEKGWVDPSNFDALHSFWHSRTEKIESWVRDDWIKQLGLPGSS